MTVTLDASSSLVPSGNPITSYTWDFGDGASATGTTASHTYGNAGRYVVRLTVTDSLGRSGNTTRYVSPANTTVDIMGDQVFQAGCPYKGYWFLRRLSYGDEMLGNSVPCTDYYPWVYFSARVDQQARNPSWVYTLYRYDAKVRNHPGYNLSEPVVLPVFNPSVAPTSTSYIQLNLTFDYLDNATIDALSTTPFAVNNKYSDGFGYLVRGSITMDLQTSRRIFGVKGATATEAQAWWLNKTGEGTGPTPHKPGPLETKFASWLEQEGNGKYDIFNGFEWYYESDLAWLNATVDSDGTTHVRVFWDGWGYDVLMARWWYWGNASYRDAVCVVGGDLNCKATLPYGAIQPRGWSPLEQCWCEQARINGRITSHLDLDFQAIQEYGFMAWANWGRDGLPGTGDDLPAWVFAPTLMDYVPRQGGPSPASEGYPNSELRWYEGLTSVHGSPGSYAYGQPYEYMRPPTRWPLNAGSTFTLILPTLNVTWYDPVRSTWNPTTKTGDYVKFSAPLTLRQICSNGGDPSSCSSASIGDYFTWDSRAKVISIAGPHDWSSTTLPIQPSPWMEFRPQVPRPPTANFNLTRHLLQVDMNAQASSDPDNDISTYQWDWGDGTTSSPSGSPLASHQYTLAGRYNITLRVVDATGLEGRATKWASVASSTLDYEFHDFFNVPYGEWWDYRSSVYGDHAINAECFNATSIADGICTPKDPNVPDLEGYPYTNWFSLPGPLSWDDPQNNPVIYAPYRLQATGTNVAGYNVSEPVFLPVLNYGQAPGSYLNFDWYMQYLDKATADHLKQVGCPTGTQDGFIIRSQVSLTMDLQESRRIFNVEGSDATAAQRWWNNNTTPACYPEGNEERALDAWFVKMGGGSAQVGKYDIANSFEYFYTPFYTDLHASVDPDGTTHVTMDHVAWGTEVLLARMFYWGNTSYKQYYLDSSKARGWWGMELAWFEDFHFKGSLNAATFDFGLDTAVQYHLRQSSSPGPNLLYDRTDDIPYWTWGPILTDYTNDWNPIYHTISELDRYNGPDGITGTADDLKYVHSTVGGSNYGKNLSYDYAPIRWDLPVGQTWHFEFPKSNVIFYDPNRTPVPANPNGDFVATMKPLTYLATEPADYGLWDATAMTWDVYGPAGTGGPSGSPGDYALEPWGSLNLGPGQVVGFAPKASFDYYPSIPLVNQTVTFDASGSNDPDGYIVSYAWDFGDGSSDAGLSVFHTYKAAGYYTVTLTVTDNAGLRSSFAPFVYVHENQPPVAAFQFYPASPKPYDNVYFVANGSYDPDGYIFLYTWDFGDGTGNYTSPYYVIYHYYTKGGDYVATLTVTDNDYAQAKVYHVVHVNVPPVANSGPPGRRVRSGPPWVSTVVPPMTPTGRWWNIFGTSAMAGERVASIRAMSSAIPGPT